MNSNSAKRGLTLLSILIILVVLFRLFSEETLMVNMVGLFASGFIAGAGVMWLTVCLFGNEAFKQ